MSNLKKQIEDAYVVFMKSKELIRRSAIASIKTGISLWESSSKNIGKTITDADIYQIVVEERKKRQDVIELLQPKLNALKATVQVVQDSDPDKLQVGVVPEENQQTPFQKMLDAITREALEDKALAEWLPLPLSLAEVENEVLTIRAAYADLPENQLIGKVMQHFKTNFVGKYDNKQLLEVIKRTANGLVTS